MNLLPFVLSFLLILIVASSTMQHTFQAIFLEKRSVAGYFRALRNSRSHMESADYMKAAKKQEEDPITEKPPKPKKTPTKRPRSYGSEGEQAKFNLSKLFNNPTDPTSQIVYDSAAELIRILYKNASFYEDGMNHKILKALLEKKEGAFSKLFEKDQELSAVFYKMLQGTSSYDVRSGKGYPPFLEFFTTNKNTTETQPVNFYFASIPVLQAVFGEELTAAVLQEESREGRLTKEKLEPFLLKQNSKTDIQTLFGFNHGKKFVTTFSDPKSGITLRKLNDANVGDEEEES
jgi:hypothetical protein